MDGGTVLGIERADPGRHLGSPVAALGAVVRVVESAHELDERPGDALHVPAPRAGWFGEPVARERGRHHVEGVAGVAAVGLGIDQSRDDVEELDDRTGPAVDEEQRKRIRVG